MSFALAHQNKVADSRSLTPAKPSSVHNHHRINNLNRNSPDYILHLQQTIGNRSVQRLMPSKEAAFDFAKIGILQPKLKVSQPGDEYEQEADKVAEQVIRMPISSDLATPIGTPKDEERVSRKCSTCDMKDEEEKENQLSIDRRTLSNSSGLEPTSDESTNQIHEIRANSGSSLDDGSREFMESRFGYNFGKVRIHTDVLAARSAQSLNALAYTFGNDIIFGVGQYQPNTVEGRRLLAHELTHVVQQNTTLAGKVPSKETIQRDLAIEPVVPAQPEVTLSRREMIGALEHNRRMHKNKTLISVLRDVLGISKTPEEIDEDFVNAVVRFQAAHGMVQDGRIGRIIAVYLAEELEAEGLPATAMMLLRAHRLAADISVDACGCIADFEDEIRFNEDIARVYLDCRDDPSVTNGPEVQTCVFAEFAARGTPLTTAGTTSSTGVIRVEDTGTDPCDILSESSTFAHEWSHFMHDRGLAERFGEGTTAFHANRENKTDWAEDEARAHTINVHHLRWMVERLKSTCTTP
jgi:hypothetical protein